MAPQFRLRFLYGGSRPRAPADACPCESPFTLVMNEMLPTAVASRSAGAINLCGFNSFMTGREVFVNHLLWPSQRPSLRHKDVGDDDVARRRLIELRESTGHREPGDTGE
jgi:hypothetical protein